MVTSKLQSALSRFLIDSLPDEEWKENARPEWLDRMELDFYFERERLAIEVQGEQHFRYCPRFHKDYSDFLSQQVRDKRKKELCEQYGIELIELYSESDLDWVKSVIIQRYRALTEVESLKHDLVTGYGPKGSIRRRLGRFVRHVDSLRKAEVKAIRELEEHPENKDHISQKIDRIRGFIFAANLKIGTILSMAPDSMVEKLQRKSQEALDELGTDD